MATSSTTDAATWTASSPAWLQRPSAVGDPRSPQARSASLGSVAARRKAGAIPHSTAASPVTAAAKTSDRASIPTGAAGNTPSGFHAVNRRTATIASTRPQAPPMQARSRLAARDCPTRRMRPAPRATRIAASRAQPGARPSHNAAMFMQAINSRQPTAPATTTSVNRTVRVLSAWSDATSTSKSAALRA